jgi:hypothetical protein
VLDILLSGHRAASISNTLSASLSEEATFEPAQGSTSDDLVTSGDLVAVKPKLKRGSGGSEVGGKVTNTSKSRSYSRIEIELELYGQGTLLGTATLEYRKPLRPGKTWTYKSPIEDPRVKGVRVLALNGE